MRYRRQIDASEVAIFTDIKKKHNSHSIAQDFSLLETAEAARFFLGNGVIITGIHAAKPTASDELKILKTNLNFSIIAGSGITLDNASTYLPICDAMIVSSYFKEKGIEKTHFVMNK